MKGIKRQGGRGATLYYKSVTNEVYSSTRKGVAISSRVPILLFSPPHADQAARWHVQGKKGRGVDDFWLVVE